MLAALALAACLSGLVAAAEAARVASVSITGVTGDDLVRAQRAVKVRAGDTYGAQALQDDVVALLALPFVMTAKATTTTTAEGVAVTYEVTAKGELAGINFTGNHKWKAKKLRSMAGLEDVRSYDLAQLMQARQTIQDKYKEAGYLFAKVDFSSQNDGSVLFTIDEGARLRVGRIEITGNTAFDTRVLRKLVKTKTRRYWFFAARLNEDTLEADRLAIQEYYRDHGYLDATCGVNLDLSKDRRAIRVRFVVTEGPLYTVSAVDVTGNTIISSQEIVRTLEMTRGTPFSPSRTTADVRIIRDDYGRRGYIDAAVSPATVFSSEGHEVSVTYRIQEGGPVTINEVAIYGDDKTRQNVIRRELEFYPGESFNTDKLEDSRKNLARLGFFSKVEIAPDAREAPGTPTRDVLVNVEEANTGQFLIGVGVNSNAGLVGNIAFIQRNFDYRAVPRDWRDIVDGRAFAGAGQYFELNAQPGTELSQLNLRYRDPRVNDSLYSFGIGIHAWERDWDTYDEDRTGGEVTVGKQLSRNAFWEASVAADSVKIRDIDPTAPMDVFAVKGTSQIDTLGLTFGHDTRDSFVTPTSGHRLTATVQGSDDLWGSDYDFLRLRLDGSWYRLVKRDKLDRPTVLSWRARVGQMWPDGPSPLFERFFAGGAYDVRGFEYRGLGPHGGDTPLGGETLALGGVQYEVPLVGDVFRGALFWDAGTLAKKPGDFSLGDVRQSVGFGVRFVIPPPLNMPIALDFGFPIAKESEDDTQVISFTIGRSL